MTLRAMRPDLKGLRISSAQVESLTQVPVGWLYRPRSVRGAWSWLRSFTAFWDSLRLLLVLDLLCRLVVWNGSLLTLLGRILIPGLRSVTWGSLALEWGIFVVLAALHQAFWMVRSRRMPLLLNLLEEVDRYNNLIQAIQINDELEEAGNGTVQLTQRAQVIEGLKLTRADLVRALKTERILRQNQAFIDSQSELFASNLATLTALQVSEQASEQGRLLDAALQIALDVRSEMQKLQERTSRKTQE
ncbi:hypothetical protein [Thermostichus vulcanus]|uniref:Uncharacterized protein n=1 Tax=Thermostichus vulcanus str. 'Rupite' TaxID=2813851 RepID=A0ABT0CCG6_THEVL|nr:hypothetical protein [Thermostichus vulcanus]MCJ2543486.1 hypothetical protein [Thermostichus vulcanus str. 'Rupite']